MPASGVVSSVFHITGLGWGIEVPLSSLEGDVFKGDRVTCPAVDTRRTVTVKTWDIPRKQGEPCVAIIVGQVRETLIRSWLDQQEFFTAPGDLSPPDTRSDSPRR